MGSNRFGACATRCWESRPAVWQCFGNSVRRGLVASKPTPQRTTAPIPAQTKRPLNPTPAIPRMKSTMRASLTQTGRCSLGQRLACKASFIRCHAARRPARGTSDSKAVSGFTAALLQPKLLTSERRKAWNAFRERHVECSVICTLRMIASMSSAGVTSLSASASDNAMSNVSSTASASSTRSNPTTESS